MKQSIFENAIATIVNALSLADEREEAAAESLIRDALDSYEFYGEEKYSSPEEARRESKSRLESVALTTPEKGREWRWAKNLHDAAREWGWWTYDAEVRLRRTKQGVALDFLKGVEEDQGPWYPAANTVTIDIVIAGQRRPCDHVIASQYRGIGKGETRRSVLTEVKTGPLMAVLSLIERR